MRKTLAQRIVDHQRLVAALDERIAQLTAKHRHEVLVLASLIEQQRSERP